MIINLSKWGSGGGSGGGVTEEQAAQIANAQIEDFIENGDFYPRVDEEVEIGKNEVKEELKANTIKEQFDTEISSEDDRQESTKVTIPVGAELNDGKNDGKKWQHKKFVVDSRANNIPGIESARDGNVLKNIGALLFIRNDNAEQEGEDYSDGITLVTPHPMTLFWGFGTIENGVDGYFSSNPQVTLDRTTEQEWEYEQDGDDYRFEALNFTDDYNVIYVWGNYSENPEGFTEVTDPLDFTTNRYSHFNVNRPCYLGGNLSALLYNEEVNTVRIPNWAYAYLFKDCVNIEGALWFSIVDDGMADNSLYVPDLYIGKHAFSHLFQNSTLNEINKGIFASVDEDGHHYRVNDSSYSAFFEGCLHFDDAPYLPSTNISPFSYDYMFADCSSLFSAPSVLPATVLPEGCYRDMFKNCNMMEYAPVLPQATTLGTDCYKELFKGCSSLANIKTFITTAPTSGEATDWMTDIAASGTYWGVNNAAMPSGWTFKAQSDTDWGQYNIDIAFGTVGFIMNNSYHGEDSYFHAYDSAGNIRDGYLSNIFPNNEVGVPYQLAISSDNYVVLTIDDIVGDKKKISIDVWTRENGFQETFILSNEGADHFSAYECLNEYKDTRIVGKNETYIKIGDDWYYIGGGINGAYSDDEVRAFEDTIKMLYDDYKIISHAENGAYYDGEWKRWQLGRQHSTYVPQLVTYAYNERNNYTYLYSNTLFTYLIDFSADNNSGYTINVLNEPWQVCYNISAALRQPNPSDKAGTLIPNMPYPDSINKSRIYFTFEDGLYEAHFELDPDAETLYPSDTHSQNYKTGMLVASGYNAKLGGEVLIIIKKTYINDVGGWTIVYAGLKNEYEKIVVGNAQSYTIWHGTQAQYDALTTYDNNTIYLIE